MFARLTADNRITLPDTVVCDFPGVHLFEVATVDGRIVLTPVDESPDDAMTVVWDKLEKLGITEADVADAVRWARQQ